MIEGTLIESITQSQSGLGRNGNEGVLHIPIDWSLINWNFRLLPLYKDAVGVYSRPRRLGYISCEFVSYCMPVIQVLYHN